MVCYVCCVQKVLDQFGKQFTWDLKAKQMGMKALASAQVSMLGTPVSKLDGTDSPCLQQSHWTSMG